jgi:murein DD-endopeptidase MepM/ murein hydrolase activator NlpD
MRHPPSAIRYLSFAILFILLASGCRAGDGDTLQGEQAIQRMQDSPTFTARPPSATLPPSTPTPTQNPPSPTPVPATLPPATSTSTPTPWPPSPSWIFPDSDVVFSQYAADFDTAAYLEQAGGFLGTYRQYLMITKWTDAPAVIDMVALENSINPRLLVALLEYQCGCVLGDGGINDPDEFTLAMNAPQAYRHDFYGQLIWAIHELSLGYYGWKDGSLTELSFPDGTIRPLPDDLNPGSAALMYLFAQLYEGDAWEQAVDPQRGFPALYAQMFGDPWKRAAALEPLVPPDAVQPPLTLPFEPGVKWAHTGGPHPAYEKNGPFAALDFAPPSANGGCEPSREWVTAMADGLIVRSGMGIVVQDLDGDGSEHTGWNLVYVHIGTEERVPAGTYLHTGERIGHPSCEGGRATGTHVHIIRKLNGEWIPADGPIPFVLDGWVAHAGDAPYLGTLTRGTEVITASMFSATSSHIIREAP